MLSEVELPWAPRASSLRAGDRRWGSVSCLVRFLFLNCPSLPTFLNVAQGALDLVVVPGDIHSTSLLPSLQNELQVFSSILPHPGIEGSWYIHTGQHIPLLTISGQYKSSRIHSPTWGRRDRLFISPHCAWMRKRFVPGGSGRCDDQERNQPLH